MANGKGHPIYNRGPSDIQEPEVVSAGPAEPRPAPDKPVSIALREALERLAECKRKQANLELEIHQLSTEIHELKEQVEGSNG